MADTTGLSVTFKGGAGFDAPWIVVHAADVVEATKYLDDIEESGITDRVVSMAAAFSGVATATSGLGATQVAQNAPVSNGDPSQQATQAPTINSTAGGLEIITDRFGKKFTFGIPGAPTCAHGAMVLKEAVSAAGKPYKQYVCSVPARNYRDKTDCESKWA